MIQFYIEKAAELASRAAFLRLKLPDKSIFCKNFKAYPIKLQ